MIGLNGAAIVTHLNHRAANRDAQAQAPRPHATRILRTAAVFQYINRAHAEPGAEIGSVTQTCGNHARRGQGRVALRKILADVQR